MFFMIENIRSKSSVWWGVVLAVAIAGIMGYIIAGPSQIHYGAKAWNWKKAEATVTGSEEVTNEHHVNLTIYYEFTVDDRKFTSRSLFSGDTYDNIHWLKNFHTTGRKVDCLYNPAKPEQSMLEYKYRMFEFFMVMNIAVIVIALGTGLVLVYIIHQRGNPSRPKSIVPTLLYYAKLFGWTCLAIFGFVCFYYAGILNFIKAAKQPERVKSEAKIIRSRMIRKTDKFSLWKDLDFAYTYTYEGKRYESSQVSAWEVEEEDIPAKYPVGKAVPCYIMPDEPENAVIEHEIPWSLWGGLVPLLVGGAGVFCFIGTVRQRKHDTAPMEELFNLDDTAWLEGIDDEEEDDEDFYDEADAELISPDELEKLRRNPFRDLYYRDKIKTDVEIILLSGGLTCGLVFYLKFKEYSDFFDPFMVISILGLIIGIICLIKDMIKCRPKV